MTTKGTLFDDLDEFASWNEEWQNMPEFIQDDKEPIQSIVVSFEKREDVEEFAKLIGQKITYKTKSIWFPQKKKDSVINKVYISKESNES